ncbi:hypothetical protein LX36DRAFT_60703 [Colletotrichum falcatum]|nr:hypothetical protein LX36DRAFT_60703 [Colletotrichum falcatum]
MTISGFVPFLFFLFWDGILDNKPVIGFSLGFVFLVVFVFSTPTPSGFLAGFDSRTARSSGKPCTVVLAIWLMGQGASMRSQRIPKLCMLTGIGGMRVHPGVLEQGQPLDQIERLQVLAPKWANLMQKKAVRAYRSKASGVVSSPPAAASRSSGSVSPGHRHRPCGPFADFFPCKDEGDSCERARRREREGGEGIEREGRVPSRPWPAFGIAHGLPCKSPSFS